MKACLKGIQTHIEYLVETENISDAWYNNFPHMIANAWYVFVQINIVIFCYHLVIVVFTGRLIDVNSSVHLILNTSLLMHHTAM